MRGGGGMGERWWGWRGDGDGGAVTVIAAR